MNFHKIVGTLLVIFSFVGVTRAQVLPILGWVASLFGSYEQPPYTLIKNMTKDVEQRLYPSRYWVCNEQFSIPSKKDTKTSEMFMTLSSYIQGKNEKKLKMDMTVPVLTKVDHRNGKLRSYEMCFYLPSEFQAAPPKPSTRGVRLIKFPQITVFSKRYGGYSSDSLEKEELGSLVKVLKEQGVSYFEMSQGDRATFFTVGYDSPGKFYRRRNEVWLLAKDTPKKINNHFFTGRDREEELFILQLETDYYDM